MKAQVLFLLIDIVLVLVYGIAYLVQRLRKMVTYRTSLERKTLP